MHFSRRKYATKFLCAKTDCNKAFSGLSIRPNMVDGDVFFYVKIWPKRPSKTPISSQFSLAAPQP